MVILLDTTPIVLTYEDIFGFLVVFPFVIVVTCLMARLLIQSFKER